MNNEIENDVLGELTVAQLKCIEMLIEGSKMDDIVKEVGFSRTQIWRWRKQKNFIAEWDRRKRDISEFLYRSANKRFEKLQDTAIDVLEQLLKESKNDNVRMETAKEILNRNIGKIATKLEVSDTTGNEEDSTDIIDGIDEWDKDTE
jgi:hypothetical protein